MSELKALYPSYSVSTFLGNDVLDSRDIADPFVRTDVTIGRWDLFLGLLKGKLRVRVLVNGNQDAIQHVMNPRPILVESERVAGWLASVPRKVI